MGGAAAPPHRDQRRDDDMARKLECQERTGALCRRLVEDLCLLHSGRDAEVEAYCRPAIAQELRDAAAAFLRGGWRKESPLRVNVTVDVVDADLRRFTARFVDQAMWVSGATGLRTPCPPGGLAGQDQPCVWMLTLTTDADWTWIEHLEVHRRSAR
jgi:hypothetical protein